VRVLVPNLVEWDYFGVIPTGGEATLQPELPEIAASARALGLQGRTSIDSHALANRKYAQAWTESGVPLAQISVYSHVAEIGSALRGTPDGLPRAY
jgi:MoaA/NifB/PqqE/SkfB family radical SAM enzyme